MKKAVNKRRLKYGSLATAMTVGLVAAVVLVNVIVSMLVERFPMDIDLTSDSIFELTNESIEYIKNLDKDVTISVLAAEDSFASQNDYYKQANEVIQKYEKYSSHITIQYIDLYTNPELQQKYPKEKLSIGGIFVECGSRYQNLTAYDLFNTQTSQQTGSTYITSSKAEQAMTSAIMNVTNANPPKVAVLGGYGTASVEGFTDMLASNGYVIEEVNLMTGELTSDYIMAILAAPNLDLSETDLEKLDVFLDNDGKFDKNLMYFANWDQPELPQLEEFLSEWGILVNPGYLYETDGSYIYFDPTYTLQQYGDETYTENLGSTSLPVLIPACRPLESAFGDTNASSNRKTSALLSTYPGAVVVPKDAVGNSESTWDPSTDGEKGSYTTAMVGSRTKYDGMTPLTSRIIAFGSVDIVNSNFLSFSAINNAEYVLNVSNIVCDKDEGVQILPKTVVGGTLGISEKQAVIIGALSQYLLPLLILAGGVVIWVRRRNK